MTTVTKTREAKRRRRKSTAEEMAVLEAAAAAADVYDVSPFIRALQMIDWDDHSADDFAQAVRLALDIGAHLTAQELAIAGAARFPDHGELQKMARILDPPPAKIEWGLPNTSWKRNKAWLQAHWQEYGGQWVALQNGELLAMGDSYARLVA